ncbi:ester cyclase [Capillimicrobium parvum]|uniref:ester cyclase n=1 Tax=Capillimicrobium parvum TaxID=2884022 RepID=UPI0038991782
MSEEAGELQSGPWTTDRSAKAIAPHWPATCAARPASPSDASAGAAQGVRRLVSGRRRAHPGLHIKIEDQIAEEDRVATRWHATTTAAAARDAGDRTPCFAGSSITRLLAGQLVDSHTEYSDLTALSERSAVPEPVLSPPPSMRSDSG